MKKFARLFLALISFVMALQATAREKYVMGNAATASQVTDRQQETGAQKVRDSGTRPWPSASLAARG
jgi:hypothetical protein